MALYIGNQRVIAALADTNSWWGGKNPVLLYESLYECPLSNFVTWNANSITTDGQYSLTYPATDHTAAGNKNPVLERWGSGYNNGTALDFTDKDYFVLIDCFINVIYTGGEENVTGAHICTAASSGLVYIYQNLKMSNGAIVYPDPPVTGVVATSIVNQYAIQYKSTSNILSYAAANSYGFYIIPVVPTFSSTSAATNKEYIQFRGPTFSARGHASYQPVAAYSLIDATSTKLKIRQRLYSVDKNDQSRYQQYRFKEVMENKNFPVELI